MPTPSFSTLKTERDHLTARKNEITAALKQARTEEVAEEESLPNNLTAESARIRDRLAEIKVGLWRLEETALLTALRLPNVADGAPAADRIVYSSGSPAEAASSRLANSSPRSHIQLMADNDLGEFSSNR
jgi:seryl-tRNA synthetase